MASKWVEKMKEKIPKCPENDSIFVARISLGTPVYFTAAIYGDLCNARTKINELLDEGLEAYKNRREE